VLTTFILHDAVLPSCLSFSFKLLGDLYFFCSLDCNFFAVPTFTLCICIKFYYIRDPMLEPTRDNILRWMKWLIADCRAGDSLFISFSGHGSQVKDERGQERDGMNETLCPVDFTVAGMIVDDEVRKTKNMIFYLPRPSFFSSYFLIQQQSTHQKKRIEQ
jgi:hypothetical protein